jgi:hypothetical protein
MRLNSTADYFLIEVNQSKLFELDRIYDNSYQGIYSGSEYAGFIIINNLNKTQSWSPHFYKTLGFGPNEITPSFESLEEILHPSDFVLFEKIIKSYTINLNRDLDIKVHYKTKSNTYILLNTRVKIISVNELKN